MKLAATSAGALVVKVFGELRRFAGAPGLFSAVGFAAPPPRSPRRRARRWWCKGRVQQCSAATTSCRFQRQCRFHDAATTVFEWVWGHPVLVRVARTATYLLRHGQGELRVENLSEPSTARSRRPRHPGGILQPRNSNFFLVEVESELEWCNLGCRKRDAHGRLPAFPVPQLAGSPARSGAARAAGGCPVRRAGRVRLRPAVVLAARPDALRRRRRANPARY